MFVILANVSRYIPVEIKIKVIIRLGHDCFFHNRRQIKNKFIQLQAQRFHYNRNDKLRYLLNPTCHSREGGNPCCIFILGLSFRGSPRPKNLCPSYLIKSISMPGSNNLFCVLIEQRRLISRSNNSFDHR
jgi:hypothetical protein